MAEPTQGQTQAPDTQPGGGQQPAAQTSARTFSQEDLDRIIDERLKRERTKYADYDDLKRKVETAEAAQKSEVEKLAEKAAKAEARQKEIETTARERLIQAEARAVAAELGFLKPLHAVKLADLGKVTVGEDGSISGVREALETLKKDSPELLTPRAPATGATNPGRGSETAQRETDEQKRARLLHGNVQFGNWLDRGQVVRYPKPGEPT